MTAVDPLATTAFEGLAGLAQVDITPPPGINARNWGAAEHDVADSLHRPLLATVLTLSRGPADLPLVLIAADLGWWKSREDEWLVRGAILGALELDPARVLLSLSHTHAGPNLYREDHDKPGGDRIEPYLLSLRDRLIAATREAIGRRAKARVTWRTGCCDLAQNRDLRHPRGPGYLVAWNPKESADDTLLVGSVEGVPSGKRLATLVNYACHPTTLAWRNHALSPDFPGALRALVEAETQAPCLFLQGASGELGTAAQHGSDPAVADRLGRRLGYAVLGVLESWPDALHVVDEVVESGAPLGIAHPHPPAVSHELHANVESVELLLKSSESLAALEQQLQACQDRALRERLWRRRAVRRIVGDGPACATPLWLWRIGEALLVAQPNEAYSCFQLDLRRRFAPRPVVVLNVTNGYAGYLPPRDHYARDQYTVWQTPFAPGGLEHLSSAAEAGLSRLLTPKSLS